MTNTAPQNNSISTYNQYKDTGIPWLGQIPAHWEVLSNKFIFELKNNKVGKNSNKYSLLSLTLNGIIKRDMENPKGKFPSNFDTYQKVNKNDFVFCLFDVEETPRCVGLSNFNGMITGAYTVFNLKKDYSNKFLYYYYLNLDNQKKMKPLYTGLRNTISFDTFMSYKIPIPPKPEQTAIARFLDRKTTQIDQAIAQKQALINRLKTYKQVLIQQAVTKGLNPDAPLKDSGVEWIGQIPAHWEVWKISHLFNYIGSGTTPPSNDEKYYNGKINFLQTGDLNDGIVNKTKKTIKKQTLKNFSALKLYPKGSLVIAMYGATIGKLGILGLDATTNQACSVLIKSKRVSNKLMFYILMAFRNEIISLSYGGGQPNISQELIKSLKFPIPPKKEQAEIVAYIEAKTTQIDHTIALQEKEIKRLQTYKTVLIDQAVTGKIKVI